MYELGSEQRASAREYWVGNESLQASQALLQFSWVIRNALPLRLFVEARELDFIIERTFYNENDIPTRFILLILDLLYGLVTAVRCFRLIPIVAIVGCGGGSAVSFSCFSRSILFSSCSRQNHRRSVSPTELGFLFTNFSSSLWSSIIN